ncbi:hypothetical protein AGMMS49574_14750 [Bacteroidia bacterium]|nr:hypothetical protein AGMMS49574_14750 [Bacteroidia bacterium]
MKKNVFTKFSSLFLAIILALASCDNELPSVDKKGITKDIHNIIPGEYIETLEELGLEIHGGNKPPLIEGTYHASPLYLVNKNFSGPIAEQDNMYVSFYDQNNTKLTVKMDYTMWSSNGDMGANGLGAFIVGEGNKFTVFVEAERTERSYTAKTVEVFSGEITADGIKNYQWAVIMVDDRGDPLNHWIENGQAYVKKDGNDLAVRQKGKLIFLTHGLNSDVTCFEKTVESLKSNKNKYYDLGYVTMKDNVKSPKIWRLDDPIVNVKDVINTQTNKGANVLVRIELSAGNLSFNEQFSQMDEMVKEFEGHFADVVFIGHSMGGLASIRYGMYYAENNPEKEIKIITVDTPYQPNNYARTVWGGKDEIPGLISNFSAWVAKQQRGDAHRDLGGFADENGNYPLSGLRNDWNQYKKNSGTAELYAISVSMYSKSEIRWSSIGDGIVDIPAQQGDFRKELLNVGKWENVTLQETIFGTGISKIGIDIATAVLSGNYFLLLFSDLGGTNDTNNLYYHSNTPKLDKVISQINDVIDRQKP